MRSLIGQLTRIWLWFVLSVGCFSAFARLSGAKTGAGRVAIQPGTDSIGQEILYYVNLDRKSKGLPPLLLNPVESSVAARHSSNMASGKTAFGHNGAESRAKEIGRQLGSLEAFGENVAFGQETARDLVAKWLQSKPHRENIEGDFALTGIGWARDKNGMTYYTEVFTK